MRPVRSLAACALVLTLACAAGDPPPAALDTKNETCRSCRMPVSDRRLAAQLTAPGEEPKFFDDIGCLRDFLRQNERQPPGTVAYVSDHLTGEWVRASSAVFHRCPALETPMGSHLIAHAGAASVDRDAGSRGCSQASMAEIFGPKGPPDGSRR